MILVLGKGDRAAAVQVLARHASQLAAPARCLRRYYDPPPEVSDAAKANAVLTECQILCLQFVFIRPLTSLIHLVLSLMNANEDDDADMTWWQYLISPSFIVTMMMNVSVFFAFRGLLKFYHACEHDLQWLQPFAKFMSIKGVVFLTFWQGLLISILVHMKQSSGDTAGDSDITQSSLNNGNNSTNVVSNTSVDDGRDLTMTPQEHAAQIQNVLICLEMLFFSIAHWCVFPWEEWQPNYRDTQREIMATPGFGIRDFVADMSDIVEQTRRRRKARPLTSDESGFYEDAYGNEDCTAAGDSTVTMPDDLVLQEQSSGDRAEEDDDDENEMI